MLQNLRDKAQGWIAWIIIGLIAITFVLFGTESMFGGNGDSKVLAKVQGVKITERDLEGAYRRFLRQPGNESIQQLDSDVIKGEILQSLIDETIMRRAAHEMGLRVGEQRVLLTLQSVPFFLQDNQFSQEAYHRYLMHAEYSDSGFRSFLRDLIIKQQLQQGVMQTSFSLDNDVSTLIKYILQKRDIRFISIAKEPFEKDIALKPEEIKQYYDAHLQDFLTDEQVSLEYVVLSLQELMNKYNPQESELKTYFKENAALFNEPERVHVEHILIAVPKNADEQTIATANEKIKDIQKKLSSGESFESLAKQYSDDKATGIKGGDLDWFSRGENIPAFEQAAFALDKNQVSPIVKTEFGFHLIKLLDKQKEKEKSFESVKDEIQTKMKQEWAQEQLATLGDQLNDLSFDHPDSLQPAAEKLSLPLQKTDLFTKSQGPKEPLLQNPIVMTAAFSANVKDNKNNSDMLKLDNENYMVLRVSKVIPSKQKPLEEVQADIIKIMKAEKGQQLALAKASELYTAILKEKNDPAKLKTQYTWQEQNDLTRSSTTVNTEIIEKAFSLPVTQSKEGEFALVNMENGDYAVLWLTKVVDGDYSKLSKDEQDNFKAQLTKHYGELEFALYATDLVKKAKVERKESKKEAKQDSDQV
ncbi:MAG: SurA N-terminal domain-containing protein [Gammaproteobacteria bacterium]|nr:SurA N-terminal domain-containing protein [Gammaproteobacteria bacterium]